MDNKICVSFDVGGTFIKYALIDNTGKIHSRDKVKTPNSNGKETIPKVVVDITRKLKNHFDVDCIGISTAGQVDVENGRIIYATDNIPGYSGADFVSTIQKTLEVPIFVDNDVNCAAAGEIWLGSGKGLKNFLCMTIGTGVGGAIVIDGEIYRGANFSAGEIGHFTIVKDGAKCTCGKNGCYESYASTSSLIRMYKEELAYNDLNCEVDYSGEYIVDLYYKGDDIAVKVYDNFLDYIAYGIANISEILDPGTIIIGGGISAQGERFFDNINKNFKKYMVGTHCQNTNIIQAGLTNDAGVAGAAFNIFSQIGAI